MFERELIILGLEKQKRLLGDLINGLETKPQFSDFDLSYYEYRTRQVAQNLRKLRRIKNNYCDFHNQ